ncbi:MAG: hypothetical protein L3J52_02365 [Proteobacteria bacterium]|nr:hypothetical protein [Pseudomonadota bacterium]
MAKIEKRAFKTAYFATKNQDDALDIVQEAMMKLAQSYAHKSENDWPPLFNRILQRQIFDYYRRQKINNQWIKLFPGFNEDREDNQIENAADTLNNKPDDKLAQHNAMNVLEHAIQNLPLLVLTKM